MKTGDWDGEFMEEKALFKYFSSPRPTFRKRTLSVNVLTFEHPITGKKCKALTNFDHSANDSTSCVRSGVNGV